MKRILATYKAHKTSIWDFVNYYAFTIIQALISFVTISFLSKNILPEDFGMLGIFGSLTFFLPNALTFSVASLQAIQIVDLNESQYIQYRNKYITFVLLNSVWVVILFLGAALIFQNFSFIILTAFIAGMLVTLGNIHSVELIQNRRPMQYGILATTSVFITFILTIIFIGYFDCGWQMRIWSILASQVLLIIIRYFFVSDIAKLYKPIIDFVQYKYFFHYGFPLIIALIGGWIINQSDKYFILRYFSMREVGLYSAAAGIAKLVLMVNQTMMKVLTPVIYRRLNQKIGRAFIFKTQFTYSFIILAFSSSICVAFYLFAGYILGDKYLEATGIIILMIFAKALFGIENITSLIIMYYKKTKIKSFLVWINAILLITGTLILIPMIGFYAPAVAGLFSFSAMLILSIIFSHKLLLANSVR